MNQSYHGFEAQWHDLFWEEEAASELPLLEDFLKEITGPSLYVGSGSGRLLGPLAQKGFNLAGLEVSPEMVALSQEKWPDASVQEGAWEDADGQWDSILMPGFTFQLLKSPSKQFKAISQKVVAGGKAYLSLFFPWSEVSGELPEGHWYLDREMTLASGEKAELRTRHFIDQKKNELRREHRYLLKSQSGELLQEEKTKQTIRIFADGELEKMIQKAGWEIEKEIQNFGEEEDVVYVITLILKKSGTKLDGIQSD